MTSSAAAMSPRHKSLHHSASTVGPAGFHLGNQQGSANGGMSVPTRTPVKSLSDLALAGGSATAGGVMPPPGGSNAQLLAVRAAVFLSTGGQPAPHHVDGSLPPHMFTSHYKVVNDATMNKFFDANSPFVNESVPTSSGTAARLPWGGLPPPAAASVNVVSPPSRESASAASVPSTTSSSSSSPPAEPQAWQLLAGSALMRAVEAGLAQILEERPDAPVAALATFLKEVARQQQQAAGRADKSLQLTSVTSPRSATQSTSSSTARRLASHNVTLPLTIRLYRAPLSMPTSGMMQKQAAKLRTIFMLNAGQPGAGAAPVSGSPRGVRRKSIAATGDFLSKRSGGGTAPYDTFDVTLTVFVAPLALVAPAQVSSSSFQPGAPTTAKKSSPSPVLSPLDMASPTTPPPWRQHGPFPLFTQHLPTVADMDALAANLKPHHSRVAVLIVGHKDIVVIRGHPYASDVRAAAVAALPGVNCAQLPPLDVTSGWLQEQLLDRGADAKLVTDCLAEIALRHSISLGSVTTLSLEHPSPHIGYLTLGDIDTIREAVMSTDVAGGNHTDGSSTGDGGETALWIISHGDDWTLRWVTCTALSVLLVRDKVQRTARLKRADTDAFAARQMQEELDEIVLRVEHLKRTKAELQSRRAMRDDRRAKKAVGLKKLILHDHADDNEKVKARDALLAMRDREDLRRRQRTRCDAIFDRMLDSEQGEAVLRIRRWAQRFRRHAVLAEHAAARQAEQQQNAEEATKTRRRRNTLLDVSLQRPSPQDTSEREALEQGLQYMLVQRCMDAVVSVHPEILMAEEPLPPPVTVSIAQWDYVLTKRQPPGTAPDGGSAHRDGGTGDPTDASSGTGSFRQQPAVPAPAGSSSNPLMAGSFIDDVSSEDERWVADYKRKQRRKPLTTRQTHVNPLAVVKEAVRDSGLGQELTFLYEARAKHAGVDAVQRRAVRELFLLARILLNCALVATTEMQRSNPLAGEIVVAAQRTTPQRPDRPGKTPSLGAWVRNIHPIIAAHFADYSAALIASQRSGGSSNNTVTPSGVGSKTQQQPAALMASTSMMALPSALTGGAIALRPDAVAVRVRDPPAALAAVRYGHNAKGQLPAPMPWIVMPPGLADFVEPPPRSTLGYDPSDHVRHVMRRVHSKLPVFIMDATASADQLRIIVQIAATVKAGEAAMPTQGPVVVASSPVVGSPSSGDPAATALAQRKSPPTGDPPTEGSAPINLPATGRVALTSPRSVTGGAQGSTTTAERSLMWFHTVDRPIVFVANVAVVGSTRSVRTPVARLLGPSGASPAVNTAVVYRLPPPGIAASSLFNATDPTSATVTKGGSFLPPKPPATTRPRRTSDAATGGGGGGEAPPLSGGGGLGGGTNSGAGLQGAALRGLNVALHEEVLVPPSPCQPRLKVLEDAMRSQLDEAVVAMDGVLVAWEPEDLEWLPDDVRGDAVPPGSRVAVDARRVDRCPIRTYSARVAKSAKAAANDNGPSMAKSMRVNSTTSGGGSAVTPSSGGQQPNESPAGGSSVAEETAPMGTASSVAPHPPSTDGASHGGASGGAAIRRKTKVPLQRRASMASRDSVASSGDGA